jgi:hypothetical protein
MFGPGSARTPSLEYPLCIHGSEARQRGDHQRGQYTQEALVAALDFEGGGA